MDPITDKTLPQAGTIYSLTVRRGRNDPRMNTGPVLDSQCFRLRVAGCRDGRIGVDWPDGEVRWFTPASFNQWIVPHVVAAYGPPPEQAEGGKAS